MADLGGEEIADEEAVEKYSWERNGESAIVHGTQMRAKTMAISGVLLPDHLPIHASESRSLLLFRCA